MVVSSPAKLNLYLRVLGKRRDGYHEIVTLFHRISLADTIHLRKIKEGIRLVCSHPRVPIKDNLIVRAFHLLKSEYPFRGGVAVRLTKRIPVAGGLGGGSSNAAAFLLGMNGLFKLKLTLPQLSGLGAKLGADIPFFLSGTRQAIGRGRGDRIKNLPFKGQLWFLLFPVDRGLATAEVYAGLGLQKSRPGRGASHLSGHPVLTQVTRDVKLLSAFSENGNLFRAEQLFVNDLTRSAERIRPALGKMREKLDGLQLGRCRMSGSGPTLFIVFPSKKKARHAQRTIKRKLGAQSVILCHSY